MACGEEQRKVAGFMAKSKFALLRRWLRDPHQDAEWRTAVGDALRPPKISRVGLDVRTMRDRGGIRAWDAELIIRKTRGQSILMPELTSLAVLCACGEWWHDAVDTATGAPLMGPPATPPTITEAAVHALLPVSMRVPMELMRKDVARLLGRDSKSVGSRSQMKGDQKAAERRSKKLLAHEAGPLPLCCVARWMSTDPYVRLRIMLSIAFDGVAPAGVSDPIESERLAHASASANMQPAAARAREQMLLKVATPRGAAQTIALEWLIEAAEVPMAPFEDETDSIQWHGDLLRTHYEWTILQVRYYSLLSLPLSFSRALSPATSAHTPPPFLAHHPAIHLQQELARRLGKTIGETLIRDRLTLLWNDQTGSGTILRGAIDLISRRFIRHALIDESQCAFVTSIENNLDLTFAMVARRLDSSGALHEPFVTPRGILSDSKVEGWDLKSKPIAMELYGQRRIEERCV